MKLSCFEIKKVYFSTLIAILSILSLVILIVGVGTLIDSKIARVVIFAGTKYIVSLGFN